MQIIKNLQIAIALVVVFLTGCSTQQSENSKNELIFSLDSLAIKIDSSQLNGYDTYGFNAEHNVFVGYNSPLNSFDLYSLESKTAVGRISAGTEGPDGIGQIEGISPIGKDSILIQHYGHLKILNASGKVIKDYNYVDQIEKNNDLSGNPISNQYVPLRYSSRTNSVLLYSLRESYVESNKSPLSLFNLTNSTFEQIPVRFPKYYKEANGNYGFMNYTNGNVVNDTLVVYNHLFAPAIYSYNLKTKQSKEYEQVELEKQIRSINISKSPEEWEKHALESTHYLEVLYDPYRQLYYQFIWKGISPKDHSNEHNSFLDKELHLRVFTPDFKQIGEYGLAKHTYTPFNWFVSKHGIILSNNHPNNKNFRENYLRFYILQFKKIHKKSNIYFSSVIYRNN
ncbi:DUF4221 family protein [Arundinibacter roseus]|uniref:DUF4221 domain-containing protein n=1 Tax=Arundinibacter roseus TaxID=2070510 RepID=A0A4R4KGU8_9BACT|nr:DUF4221 family protein [Arundinibacter roseus]TDB65811.1 DUF4221 domain-containing protein [Arundinibacter roseus]